jgi:hypothetical protein
LQKNWIRTVPCRCRKTIKAYARELDVVHGKAMDFPTGGIPRFQVLFAVQATKPVVGPDSTRYERVPDLQYAFVADSPNFNAGSVKRRSGLDRVDVAKSPEPKPTEFSYPFDISTSMVLDQDAMKVKVLVVTRDKTSKAFVDTFSAAYAKSGVRFWALAEKDDTKMYVRLNRTEDFVTLPSWLAYSSSPLKMSVLLGEKTVSSQMFSMNSVVTCRTDSCVVCWDFVDHPHCHDNTTFAIVTSLPLTILFLMFIYLRTLVLGLIWIIRTTLLLIKFLILLPFRCVRWICSKLWGDSFGRPRSTSGMMLRVMSILVIFIKFAAGDIATAEPPMNIGFFKCDELVFLDSTRFQCSGVDVCKVNLRGLTFEFGSKNVTACVADESGRTVVAITLLAVQTRLVFEPEYYTSDRNISVYSETFCEDAPDSTSPSARFCLDGFEGSYEYSSSFLVNQSQVDIALQDPNFVDFYNKATLVLDAQKIFHLGGRSCSGQSCKCLPAQKRMCTFSGLTVNPTGAIFQVGMPLTLGRLYDVHIQIVSPVSQALKQFHVNTTVAYPPLSDQGNFEMDSLEDRFKPSVLLDSRMGSSSEIMKRLCNSENNLRLINRFNTRDWWCTRANAPGDFNEDRIGDIQASYWRSLEIGRFFDYSASSLIHTATGEDTFWYEAKPSHLNRLVSDPLAFPALIDRMLWVADNDGVYTNDRFDNERIQMALSSDFDTLTIPAAAPVVCPEVTFKSLTGCYNCQLGAVLRLEVRSSCESGLAWIESSVLTNAGIGLVKWLDGGRALSKDDGKLRLAFFATEEIHEVEFRVFYDEPTMMDIFTVYPKIKGQTVPRTVIVQSSLSVPTPDIRLVDPALKELNETELADELNRRQEVMYRIERAANWTMDQMDDNVKIAFEYRKYLLTFVIVVLSIAIVHVIIKGGKKRNEVEVKIWVKMTREEYLKMSPSDQKKYVEFHSKK